MRDHVRGDFLGDWYGPHRYGLLDGLLAEPAELHAVLRDWGVDFLLVARRSGTPVFAPGPEAGFELLYADGSASLYALRPARRGGGR
jgi:hypothetical protein